MSWNAESMARHVGHNGYDFSSDFKKKEEKKKEKEEAEERSVWRKGRLNHATI